MVDFRCRSAGKARSPITLAAIWLMMPVRLTLGETMLLIISWVISPAVGGTGSTCGCTFICGITVPGSCGTITSGPFWPTTCGDLLGLSGTNNSDLASPTTAGWLVVVLPPSWKPGKPPPNSRASHGCDCKNCCNCGGCDCRNCIQPAP